jgi:endonuclease YncB( thermonuclease family)
MKKKKLTTKELVKKGVPYVLIPGLAFAIMLGWKADALGKIKDFSEILRWGPEAKVVKSIEDGDTFTLSSGVKIRLLGVDAPSGETRAKNYLVENVLDERVYLEYDRYQDDKYGRFLAWVWIDCETTPVFLPADYMHKNASESMPGLTENPKGCKKGKLVNEELVKKGFAKTLFYKDRGELKYEQRLQTQK